MLDGFLARKLHTESEHGAMLDTAADLIFALAYAVKLLPQLHIPRWLWIWTAIIAAAKVTGILIASKRACRLYIEHSVFNKLTGLLMFLLPLSARFADVKYGATLVCVAATGTTINEIVQICRGNVMKENAVIYIHGKGGNADEAEHYKALFPDHDVIGFDYHAKTPWEAKDEFTEYFDKIGKQYRSVILIANSIGAFFTMNAEACGKVEKAFFISPIVDMERLITDMMMWAGVTEDDLHQKKEIVTDFGETLLWEYLYYVKENPILWVVPTHILYGEKDNLTSIDTVRQFAVEIGAALDVMPGGEHWFHTEEQRAYLDEWIKRENSQ